MSKIDRRKFLKSFFSHALKHIQHKISFLDTLGDENSDSPHVKKLRPPGASPSDEEFQSLCTGCDACMAACPIDAIMIEDLSLRYPLLYPETIPCVHCEEYPCIASCETDALSEKNGFILHEI